MLWWRRLVAWLKGEELKIEHLIPELTAPVRRLNQYADAKIKEAEQAAIDAERALARKVAAEVQRIKTDAVVKKVTALYQEVDALLQG